MHYVSALRILGAVALTAVPAFASGGGGEIADPAHGWDVLWEHVLLDLFVIGGLFAVVAAYWLFKYRADSAVEIGKGPVLSRAQMFGWALIPAFIFMADDFYLAANGWTLWNTYRTVPKDALEVKVTASMWSWSFEYDNGAVSDVLKVPAGRPVVLRMTSEDVVHSFFLPKHRVKEDVMPGRVTYLWFYPKEAGKTYVTCTEFCGAQHAEMNADVEAIPAEEFNAWLASAVTKAAPAASTGEPASAPDSAPGSAL